VPTKPLIELGGSSIVEHAAGETTGGAFTLLEITARPGYPFPPAHVHEREDELSYVIEGALETTIGDETTVAHAGESIFQPRGIPHMWGIAGDEQVRFLALLVPGGLEGYFRGLADMVRATGGVDREAANALMEQYGLRSPSSSDTSG
jgi:quercetin dioxygenase-like cupin family protein